jgi:hypothetical protein
MLKSPENYFVVKDGENPQGVELKDMFMNLSILQDRVNGFVGEYIDAFGYSKYLTSSGSLHKDLKGGTLPKPDPAEIDIDAYNAYAKSFFQAIEAMRTAKQQQNAAIVYSYLKSSTVNDTEAWPIMQIAMVENFNAKDKTDIQTFLKTTAVELDGKIQKAMKALKNLKYQSAPYTTMSGEDEEDAEDPIGIDSEELNNTLNQLFSYQDKLEPRL